MSSVDAMFRQKETLQLQNCKPFGKRVAFVSNPSLTIKTATVLLKRFFNLSGNCCGFLFSYDFFHSRFAV